MKYMCKLLAIKGYDVVAATEDYSYVILDNREDYKAFMVDYKKLKKRYSPNV